MISATAIADPELGEIRLRVNVRATRFIARWRVGHVELTVPPSATLLDVKSAVESLKPRLLSKRPAEQYSVGQVIMLDGLSIVIDRQSLRPDSIIVRPSIPLSRVSVGCGIDLSDVEVTERIAAAMRKIAHRVAPQLLFPRAREIADALECSPAGWLLGSGRRVLGTCRSDRTIRISSACVFLPAELRDYIVCHELAHLSEMNHGPGFHEVCNRYCGGRERELAAKLRRFKWPV